MSDIEITITIKQKNKDEWECDGCHQMTTAEPIDDEGGQYCFCSLRCLWRYEDAHN